MYYFVKQKAGEKTMWLHIAYPTKKSALAMLPQVIDATQDGAQIILIKVCKKFDVWNGKAIQVSREV